MKKFIFSLLLFPVFSYANPQQLTLEQAMQLAEQASPKLQATRLRTQAAQSRVGMAQSGYLPTLKLEVIDSGGFPGSSGLTGVGGLMGSPYRSGAAYGLVGQQTVWDFGRTSRLVAESESESKSRLEDDKLARMSVRQEALMAFYDCAHMRSLYEVWSGLVTESLRAAQETDRFVKTGQRSVVENYLAKSQNEEVLTQQADYAERLHHAVHQLAILIGENEGEVACPALSEAEIVVAGDVSEQNPLLERARLSAQAAHEHVRQVRANENPVIVAVGSVGGMDKSRLVDKQDYAIGAGLIIPLLDWKVSRQVQEADVLAQAKDHDVEAARMELQELNSRYDDRVRSARIRLDHLSHELTLAEQGFRVAKKRYDSTQGSLVDFRETLRNLARIRVEVMNTRAEFQKTAGIQAILNGKM